MNLKSQTAAKSELRRHFKKTASEYLSLGVHDAIVRFVRTVLPESGVIGAYLALPDEPNLAALFSEYPERFAFPRVEQDELAFYVVNSDTRFESNVFGIAEPTPGSATKVALPKLAAILVPAVAFDRKGHRLGRGKGFYDRLLSGYSGLKIGIGSAVQVAVEELPHEPHDVVMDVVVTDRYVLRRFDAA